MKLFILNLLHLIIQCQPSEYQRNSEDNYISEQNYNSQEQQFTSIDQNQEETSFLQFLSTILILGLITFFLSKIFSTNNKIPNSKSMNFENHNNKDEQNQKLNSIAQKFKRDNIEFKFYFNNQWMEQKLQKVQITSNFDSLTFNIHGSDFYGSWILIGEIIINKMNQVETFSRKIYDDLLVQGEDILIYYGQLNDQTQTFNGFWQYQKDIQKKGEWELSFKNQ
ncbi:unnamed protein product [Paramecium sonneborni]|uniref:Uncharacterized protein n=1 Tax=Paramecium sonneborni TaxID=65129 RepID=A0A8S1NRX7_9CILI|nr:unnamed protein product [Paramecium sonneborni]